MRRPGAGVRGGRGWQEDGRRFRRGPGGEDFGPDGDFGPDAEVDLGSEAGLAPIYVPDDVGLDGGPEST